MIRKCFLIPLSGVLTKYNLSRDLKFLEKSQWWTKKKLENYQNEKLKKMVKHAYDNVPYYHRIFKKEGINLEKIKTKEDLKKIPTLSKDDIRKNLDNMKATNVINLVENHSSGSTGEPLKYYTTKYVDSHNWAQVLRQWVWNEYNLGDPYVKISLNKREFFIKKIQDFIMNCIYIHIFDINEKTLIREVVKIKKSKAKILYSYASSIYLLARYMKEAGITNDKIKAVITQGDILFPHYRKLIESQFGCKVFDSYGGDGIAVSFECEKHKGYHIADENVIVEFLRNGERVSEGKLGEIVLTGLNNYGMPLIRYKIKDLGTPSDSICSCGRNLSMMGDIKGRDTDIVVLANGNFLIVHFFTWLFEYIEGVDQFQVIQNSLDNILVKIVKNNKFKKSDFEYIENTIKSKMGEAELNIEFVESIPLTKSGKRRFVISNVKKW